MKAMIFAAGLGTRLLHYTTEQPKALVKVQNRSMLEWQIRKLLHYGITEVIVNIHHFSEMMKKEIERLNSDYPVNISISDENHQLLDTAGGLKKAEKFLGIGSFLLVNVDIFSELDYSSLISDHIQSNAIATLAVRKRDTSRYFLFNKLNELKGWENRKNGERITHAPYDSLHALAFSGVHCVHSDIFSFLMPEKKCSITNTYIDLSEHKKIRGFVHNEGLWFDAGKPEVLRKLENIKDCSAFH